MIIYREKSFFFFFFGKKICKKPPTILFTVGGKICKFNLQETPQTAIFIPVKDSMQKEITKKILTAILKIKKKENVSGRTR